MKRSRQFVFSGAGAVTGSVIACAHGHVALEHVRVRLAIAVITRFIRVIYSKLLYKKEK